MNLSSPKTLIARLKRGRKTRQQFVDSHLTKTRAHQIRAMREAAGWTQQQLAERIGTNQNGVYRLESTGYRKPTLTTLRKVAAAFDVALIVRFVPFSELIDWVGGTPRVDRGLRTEALIVSSFDHEYGEGSAVAVAAIEHTSDTDTAPPDRSLFDEAMTARPRMLKVALPFHAGPPTSVDITSSDAA